MCCAQVEGSDFGVLLLNEAAAATGRGTPSDNSASTTTPTPSRGEVSATGSRGLEVSATGAAALLAYPSPSATGQQPVATSATSATAYATSATASAAAFPHVREAVTAATMDVYGKEMAKLDLLSTKEDARGQGHCR
jgi:hypothetical protein